MEIEIAAILTVACKLAQLERILDKRMERAALDTVSPTLPLLEKVRKLGEYKRLAANLAVMEHRLRCALGDDANLITYAANGRYGLTYSAQRVRAAFRRAKETLENLGVRCESLKEYGELPLYAAECKKLRRLRRQADIIIPDACRGAAFACFPGDRTAQAL